MGKNKVTFGLKNVHVAFMTEGATPTWAVPIKIPGAVAFTPSPEGGTSTFHADDSQYFTMSSNNGYTGDLEMALFPDEVLKEMLGWETDANGALIEVANGKPKKFALLGEVQGDQRNRRFVYYNVQANRPSNDQATKTETVEPNTRTLPVTIAPIEIAGKTVVKGDLELSDTNTLEYDGFFEAVYTPTFA